MKRGITFWDLIGKNEIEIPIIQRDYAQGRIEDKINAIRENFITTLLNTIVDSENYIHLGFIYGKLEGKDKVAEQLRNKDAVENLLSAVKGYAKHLEIEIDSNILNNKQEANDRLTPKFIPLDGQQRLTTLFLLHWYFVQFAKDNSRDKFLKTLERFSYKTRKSSLAFCRALCDSKNQLSAEALAHKSIAAEIKNSTWFLNTWLRDSTVKGMLVTLDEIHSQTLKISNKSDLLNSLLFDQKIKFDFLDLNELKQTDELYVKMNARGVQLTEFEHFKAWLQNYINGEDSLKKSIIEDKWKIKIDKDWLDLFWRVNKNSYYIDGILYNAFKQIPLLEFIASNENIDENLVKAVRDKNYISFKEFEKHQLYNTKSLNFLFAALNAVTDLEKVEQYRNWLHEIAISPFIKEGAFMDNYFVINSINPDLPETVYYYSFLLFITDEPKLNDEDKELAFKNWMRICRNLIFNTYVQNPKNFIDAIQSLRKISEFKSDIFGAIRDPEIKIDFFNKRQLEEEKLKIELIASHPEWKNAIIITENHSYFQGKIGFLLKFSKDQTYDLNQFKIYSKWANELYGDTIRLHEKKLLERALLATGDYLPKVQSNYTFCLPGSNSLRERRDNWHRFFDSDKVYILKELIDLLENESYDEIEEVLYRIVDSFEGDDWRKFVINCPSTISFCKQGFLRFNSNSDVSLLKTSRAYGAHVDLRTYNFYIKGFKKDKIEPFQEQFFFENPKNQYKHSCIRLKDWKLNGQKYVLEISFKEDSYCLDFHNEDESVIDNSEIQRIIKKRGWNLKNDNGYVVKRKTQSDLSKELNSILSEFKILVDGEWIGVEN